MPVVFVRVACALLLLLLCAKVVNSAKQTHDTRSKLTRLATVLTSPIKQNFAFLAPPTSTSARYLLKSATIASGLVANTIKQHALHLDAQHCFRAAAAVETEKDYSSEWLA